MKILFTQNAQGIGGSENYLLRLLPALMARGHIVAFAGIHNTRANGSIDEVNRWMQSFRDQGIPVFFRKTRSYIDPTIPWWLWRKFRYGAPGEKSFDILHTHLIYADFWATCIRLFTGNRCPVVSTVHGYEERILERFVLEPEKVPHNLYWQVFNASHRFISCTYSCSEGLRDFYAKAGIHKAESWPVVEHGFDFPQKLPKDDPDCRLGSPQIAVVGRLIRRKGVALALQALQQLKPDFPDIKMVIIGSGPEAETLYEQAESMGLNGSIHFQGFDVQPLRWMLASDVVLVPSYAEGLPLVIFEAFYASKPVVAFDTIGCRDLIVHNETGILAKAFDVDDLAMALKSLLNDHVKSAYLTQTAYNQLFKQFNLERMTIQTEHIYESVLGQKR